MRSERALLIDADVGGTSRASLQAIIDPYFEFDVVVERTSDPEVVNTDFSTFSQNSTPALIFIIVSTASVAAIRKLIKTVKSVLADVPIILVLDQVEPQDIMQLLDLGPADFLTVPLKPAEVLPRALRWLKRSELAVNTTPPSQKELALLIGENSVFLELVRKIPTIASCDANVILAGETGTGKELYSRAIHYRGPRKDKPFVPVNCGAIPTELVENELFGHERGAFTSASAPHVGLVEESNGGTLFLDEIDCLPLYSQVKLLRFIQEKEYRPLGSTKMRTANVRIIAASNVDLLGAVEQGKLRRDLFYRLSTIPLTLPPLRERREDIPLLARHFLERYSRSLGKNVQEISSEALCLLMVQRWPGNIRELEHVIEQATILCEGPVLRASDLKGFSASIELGRESLRRAKANEIARFEKNYVQGLLCACHGNITKAAQVAQKNRRAFWQLIQKHQIDVKKIKASAA